MLERELLAGIKAQLLDDSFVKKVAKEIHKRLREEKKPSHSSITHKLAEIDRRIENVVESLASVGRSKALTEKLRKLEGQRQEIATQADDRGRAPTKFVVGDVANVWRRVVEKLEDLKDYAKPDEVQTAREALASIIGEVEIKEEPNGVFAYTRLNAISGYKAGAQERT